MAKVCKYYQQQKQVSYDNGVTWQNVVPAEYRTGDLIEPNSQNCGYVPVIDPIYRWKQLDAMVDYYCEGTTKYYKEQRQQSTDGGVHWTNVTPAEYRKGGVAQEESVSCGYVPPGPDTSVFTFSDGTTYKNPTRTSDAGTYEIGLICTYNESPVTYTVTEGCDWILDNYTITPTSFKFSYTQNTSTSSRTCRIVLYQQYTYANISIEITQNGKGSTGETYMYWNIANHYDEYSTTVDWNRGIQLETFSSLVNGVATNATITADKDWVVTSSTQYYSSNEFRPNVNGQQVILSGNTTEYDRSAVITFHQKGTSNVIRLNVTQKKFVPDCTIEEFEMDAQNCRGNDLDFSFEVPNECKETFTFTLWDSAGNSTTSSVKASGGVGEGHFSTDRLALGNATCDVTVDTQLVRYTCLIKDCSTPPPAPTTVDASLTFRNLTGNIIYLDWADIVTNAGTRSVYLGKSYEIAPNAWSPAISVEIPVGHVGETVSKIQARDTVKAHMGYINTTFNGSQTIADGASWAITVNKNQF